MIMMAAPTKREGEIIYLFYLSMQITHRYIKNYNISFSYTSVKAVVGKFRFKNSGKFHTAVLKTRLGHHIVAVRQSRGGQVAFPSLGTNTNAVHIHTSYPKQEEGGRRNDE